MTDTNGLQHSVQAMGFAELGLAFAALGCYSLALNGTLSTRGRSIAAACAALAAGVFAAWVHPWTNGVILVVLGIAAMGVFVTAAWVLSAVCRLTLHPRAPVPFAGAAEGAPQGSVTAVPRPLPRAPIHSA